LSKTTIGDDDPAMNEPLSAMRLKKMYEIGSTG
jgi:hypothetical protein